MSTSLQIGRGDHGREMTYEEFVVGDFEEGHKYELIDGRLYVSPQPNVPHDWVAEHVHEILTLYKKQHPQIVKRLSTRARVFVAGRRKTTCPEPDFSIYQQFPTGRQARWQDASPLIVVEVVSRSDPDKDYQRNVELYRQVPSILEYWVFDRCDEEDGPVLRVYRRDHGGQDWSISDFGPDATYKTELLPGLELLVTPPE